MKVLVVSKTTNLDLHGEDIRKKIALGLLPPEDLHRLEQTHRDHYETKDRLLSAFKSAGIDCAEVSRGRFWPSLESFSVIVTVGGDGTVLEASHHILNAGLVLIGIRSSATSVGHLCAGDASMIPQIVRMIQSADFSEAKSVARLAAIVTNRRTGAKIHTDPILNDFLYANANPAATTRYRLHVGQRTEEQKSSGIWVATPAGSTAAIGAAGGRAVDIFGRDYQYLIRELYHPPGVIPFLLKGDKINVSETELCIENRCDHGILALDGQHGTINLEYGDMVSFVEAPPILLFRSHH